MKSKLFFLSLALLGGCTASEVSNTPQPNTASPEPAVAPTVSLDIMRNITKALSSDEFDPNWDWSGAEADMKLYYSVARALAETDDWPNWNEGDEFRAIRDASRGR